MESLLVNRATLEVVIQSKSLALSGFLCLMLVHYFYSIHVQASSVLVNQGVSDRETD